MNKKLYLAMFSLLVLALFVGTASATLETVAPGTPVFIGEEGVDVQGYGGENALAWFNPGDDPALGDEPAKIITITVQPAGTYPNLFISPADYRGYEGKWYWYTTTTSTVGPVAFTVEEPSIDIRIYDYTQAAAGKIVNDGTIVKSNQVGFTLVTNLYKLYSVTNRPGFVAGDLGMQVYVVSPGGATLAATVSPYTEVVPPFTATIDVPTYLKTYTGQSNGLYPTANIWQVLPPVVIGYAPDNVNVIWDTGNDLYVKGTYQIYANCNVNHMRDNDAYGVTQSATYELSLKSDELVIEASADKVIRNNDFSVTVTGQPSRTYFLWISDANSMNNPNERPPQIQWYQDGVLMSTGVLAFRAYPYKTGTNIGQDTVPLGASLPGGPGWNNYVALITLSKSGSRTIGFTTNTLTKEGTYKIRVQNVENLGGMWSVAPYFGWATASKYDVVKVKVEKGEVTITASGDKSYYLGEEVTFEGDNTDTGTTYLFITGPNLPINGGFIDDPTNPPQGVSSTLNPILWPWTPVSVTDDKWSYKWDTAALELDAGTYTIYAVSTQAGKSELGTAKYDTVSVVIKKPFVKGSVSASAIAKGDKLIINGRAEGNPQAIWIWVLGKNFVGTGAAPGPVSVNVEDDGTFEYKYTVPNTMASGQYFVVVQHPMYNDNFDIRATSVPVTLNTVTTIPNPTPPPAFLTIPVQLNVPAGETWVYDPAGAYFVLAGANKLQGSDAANALVKMMDSPDVDDTYAKLTFLVEEPWIMIDPIGDHYVGDTFTITGTTNLAVDDELLVDIVSSSFQPTDKTQPGEFSGTSGTVLVTKGDTYNEWAFDVDASTFKPDEYIVSVESIVSGTTATDLFNVLVAPETTEVPTEEPTEEPTEVPTTAPATTTPEPSPGFGALIALAGLGAVAVLVLRKH